MKTWLVPCNVKNFDIFEYLKTSSVVYFKKNRALKAGDIVYIYLAKPYAEIRFRGVVKESSVNYKEARMTQKVANTADRTYVAIEIEKEFDEGTLVYSELKTHGLNQVVNQQLIRGDLASFIVSRL